MSMFPIARVIANGTSGITFTNIPQTFTHLQLRVFIRSTVSGVQDFIYIRFNSDSSNNYVSHNLIGDGSSTASTKYGPLSYSGLTDVPGATATANIFGSSVVDILDYTNTNKLKTVRAIGGYDRNGGGTTQLASGLYMSTNAITAIECASANNVPAVGSVVCLYGISTSNATGA